MSAKGEKKGDIYLSREQCPSHLTRQTQTPCQGNAALRDSLPFAYGQAAELAYRNCYLLSWVRDMSDPTWLDSIGVSKQATRT